MPVVQLNDSLFKRSFKNPRHTFIVHYVVFSDTTCNTHYVAIWGTQAVHAQLNDYQLKTFMDLWTNHGEPMVPSYRTRPWDPESYERIDLTTTDKTPARKKRKVSGSNGVHSGRRRTRSLYEKHLTLVQDWDTIAPARRELQRLTDQSGAVPGLSTVPSAESTRYADTLLRAVESLVVHRDPWTWTKNSCHLDCWLLVELAVYNTLARRKSFTDDLVLSSVRLKRLFKVLLEVGASNQDQLRDSYWAMEIEEYRGPSARADFGKVADYDLHRNLVYSDVAVKHLTSLSLCRAESCSSPTHEDIRQCVQVQSIQATDSWYSMPPDNQPVQRQVDTDMQWQMPSVVEHDHADAADMIATMVARSDSQIVKCKTCSDLHFVSTTKVLEEVRMPISLTFNVFGAAMPIKQTFKLGGLKYDLIGVVFGNGGHFICNVQLNGRWFSYDDLGIKYTSTQPTTQKNYLVGTTPQACASPPNAAGYATFRPVSARYLRSSTSSLDPLPFEDLTSVPTEQQFKEFASLWDCNDGAAPIANTFI